MLFPYQQSKLEKADILEMTVKHLQNIQSSKMMGEIPFLYPVPSPLPGASRFDPLAAWHKHLSNQPRPRLLLGFGFLH